MARPDKYDVAKKRKSKSLYGNGTIVHEKRPLNSPLLCIAYFPVAFWVDCKTVSFFLKISKEIGKAWRKSLTRAKREPHTPVGRVRREKNKPTVRFPYNEFVPTREFKTVVELSKICSQLRPLCESDTLGN